MTLVAFSLSSVATDPISVPTLTLAGSTTRRCAEQAILWSTVCGKIGRSFSNRYVGSSVSSGKCQENDWDVGYNQALNKVMKSDRQQAPLVDWI